MEQNKQIILSTISVIEEHLDDTTLCLDTIAASCGYSKYHLHRMFQGVCGIGIHAYLQRRRLNEAAKALVTLDTSILEIALASGYESQRSFDRAFKQVVGISPSQYRKQATYLPIQLPLTLRPQEPRDIKKDMKVTLQPCKAFTLIGYQVSTKHGFRAVGGAWRKLHHHKHLIQHRSDPTVLIGLNDYRRFLYEEGSIFDMIIAAEVTSEKQIPKGMQAFQYPACTCAVFSYRGKCEDSVQPIVEMIYQEWLPDTTFRFDEATPFDFVKYGECIDDAGNAEIQIWIPLLPSCN